MNPYATYYVNQAGTGLAGFSGVRYQRGHGFFGRLFSGIGSFVKDLLPALGKRALPSGIGLAQDILAGENVLKSAKSRLVEAGKNVADETLDKIKTRLQKGSGIIRRRPRGRLNRFTPIKRRQPKSRKKRVKVNKKTSIDRRFPNFLR